MINTLRYTWLGIMNRCHNPNSIDYPRYGGRGISVHKEWREDRNSFYKWINDNLGKKPARGYSLDRIDNNGNYEPGNLRWATPRQQMRNRRNRVIARYNNRDFRVPDLARELSISRQAVYQMQGHKANKYGIVFSVED